MVDSSKCTDSCTHLRDLSNTTCTNEVNTINISGPTTSIVQPTLIDPKERKRQRVRERYAQMASDQKEEFLKNRHEAYKQRKIKAAIANFERQESFSSRIDQCYQRGSKQSTLPIVIKGLNGVHQSFLEEVTASNQENIDPSKNGDCFCTSDYQRHTLNYPIPGNKNVHDSENHIRMSEEQRQSRWHPNSIKTYTNGDCATCTFSYENSSIQKLTNDKIEAKRARNRAHYASMTPE